MRPSIDTVKRRALGVIAPRRMMTICHVDLAVHDSEPSALKPVILCLHAIGHGGRDFQDFENSFSDKFRIITVDWPGQGFSAQDTQPASALRYHELLVRLMDELKLQQVILLGNSIGGAAALRYAYTHPERVRKMVICNPGGLDQGGVAAKIFLWWMERQFSKGLTPNNQFLKWFHSYYDKVLITDHAKEEKMRILAAAYEIAPRLVEAWRSFRDDKNDLKPLVSKISTPILFAWAVKDQYVQLKRNLASIRLFPNAELVRFEAGHCPFLETPDEFNQKVAEFLEDRKAL